MTKVEHPGPRGVKPAGRGPTVTAAAKLAACTAGVRADRYAPSASDRGPSRRPLRVRQLGQGQPGSPHLEPGRLRALEAQARVLEARLAELDALRARLQALERALEAREAAPTTAAGAPPGLGPARAGVMHTVAAGQR